MKELEFLDIEISSACQADCIMCVRNDLKFTPNHMTFDMWKYVIERAVDDYKKIGGGLKFISACGMGEPLLDPTISDKFYWLKENYPNIGLGLTTNAGLLKKNKECLCECADVLKISNYGMTKESYEKIHGGSLIFEDVKNQIEEFISIPRKNRPKVAMSFLMLPENKGEEVEWRNYWEPKVEEITIWKPHNWGGDTTSETVINPENCITCGRPGKEFVVRSNGEVTMCQWDYNRQYVLGNINKQSFIDIMQDEPFKKLINIHKNSLFFKEDIICNKCDQIMDRSDALVYSSDENFILGENSLFLSVIHDDSK